MSGRHFSLFLRNQHKLVIGVAFGVLVLETDHVPAKVLVVGEKVVPDGSA